MEVGEDDKGQVLDQLSQGDEHKRKEYRGIASNAWAYGMGV